MKIFFVIVLLLTSVAVVDVSAQSTEATQEVPAAKQTSLGLYVTAKEAYEKWKATPGQVKILDVRTPEEYGFVGHGEMVWNIPFGFVTYEWDKENDMYVMAPNSGFVAQVQELAKPDDTILLMCRSGGRSAKAVDALAEAGFTNAYSIIDGMEGDKVDDPESLYHGKRMKNGWKNSGLPWTYEIDRERMRLPQKADK